MTDLEQARASPGWRPLAVLAFVVIAAHVLVLQATPAQLAAFGGARAADDLGSKTFATRSISAPAPPAEPQAVPKQRAAAPAVAQAPKNKPNRSEERRVGKEC